MKKFILFFCLGFLFFSFLNMDHALAKDGYVEGDLDLNMTSLLCNALKFLTGTVGKTLAAFACIGVSLGFVAGKVAWTAVLAFSLGMACIFGAPQIVRMFTGDNEKVCQDN